jgi:hypothetical protein
MNDTIAKIKDTIEITAVNGGAVMVSTLSEIEQGLRILSLAFAIIYTAIRIFQLTKKNNK